MQVKYNVAYCPEFNPIEDVWGLVKAALKRKKLTLLLQDKVINHKMLAIETLQGINASTISSVCQKIDYNDMMIFNM